jgi:hypothetical protein
MSTCYCKFGCLSRHAKSPIPLCVTIARANQIRVAFLLIGRRVWSCRGLRTRRRSYSAAAFLQRLFHGSLQCSASEQNPNDQRRNAAVSGLLAPSIHPRGRLAVWAAGTAAGGVRACVRNHGGGAGGVAVPTNRGNACPPRAGGSPPG